MILAGTYNIYPRDVEEVLYENPKVLEVAVAGQCDCIVTYNKRDFAEAGSFGLELLTPREFLIKIGALK